jgi:hypothetical protein
LAGTLRQRHFGDGSSDAAIAVFERVDALEIKMRESRARERRQRGVARRARGVVPPEWFGESPVEVDEHFRNASFGRRVSIRIGLQPELASQSCQFQRMSEKIASYRS